MESEIATEVSIRGVMLWEDDDGDESQWSGPIISIHGFMLSMNVATRLGHSHCYHQHHSAGYIATAIGSTPARHECSSGTSRTIITTFFVMKHKIARTSGPIQHSCNTGSPPSTARPFLRHRMNYSITRLHSCHLHRSYNRPDPCHRRNSDEHGATDYECRDDGDNDTGDLRMIAYESIVPSSLLLSRCIHHRNITITVRILVILLSASSSWL